MKLLQIFHRNRLSMFLTCKLVKELKRREEVRTIFVEPYGELTMDSDGETVLNDIGPITILVIKD